MKNVGIIAAILFVSVSFMAACSGDDENNSSSSASSEEPGALIYISEYVEGSGSNKYIEIYNPRALPFDASGWSLRQYNNGASAPTEGANYTLALSGSIPSKGVLVVCNSAATVWEGTADISTGANVMDFNGNDPMGLFNGAALVDIVGTPGNSENHIQNMALVRRPGKGPSAVFEMADWYQLWQNDVGNLGAHDPVNGIPEPSSSSASALPISYPAGAAGSGLFISEYFDGANNDKYIELYNGTSETINLADYRLLRVDIDNAGNTNAANSYCLQLSGSLYQYHVLVVINGGYSAARLSNIHALPTTQHGSTWKIVEPPGAWPHGICFFGGNDPVYLVDAKYPGQEKVIDAVGAAASPADWGSNKVWVRSPSKKGNPVWDANDWMDDDLELEQGNPDAYADFGASYGGWHQP